MKIGQKNVTSRVFTCFHYKHIEKNDPPTGGHVFSPIWTIFELVRHINKTNVLINFHDDWAKIVTSRVFTRKTAPPTGGHVFQWTGTTFELNQHIINTDIFKLDRDFIGTNLLTKFHDRTDGRRTGHKSSPEQSVMSIFGNLNAKCDGKTDRQTDGRTTDMSKAIYPLFFEGGHNKTYFKLDRDFIGTKLLTKFHEDPTINVASRERTDGRRTKTGHKSSPEQSDHLFIIVSKLAVKITKQEHRLAGADRSSIFFLKVKGLSFSITKEGGCGGVGVGTGDGLGG
ncbi:hypothetical protein DPMN_120451 [Dreissena polymorpha]|uniref:Uncharacterized protein n=1 Tax=Dreissena polymorpha TaxID=45954 RepID=A0A9D4GNN7_DREPO|nr:hypothetical protein DPMN_120451 [Dreissena polymorpha]